MVDSGLDLGGKQEEERLAREREREREGRREGDGEYGSESEVERTCPLASCLDTLHFRRLILHRHS